MAVLSIELQASFPMFFVRKSFQDAFKLLPWSVIKSACQSISPKLRFCNPSHARSSFWLCWNVRKSLTKRRIKRICLIHRSGGFILLFLPPGCLLRRSIPPSLNQLKCFARALYFASQLVLMDFCVLAARCLKSLWVIRRPVLKFCSCWRLGNCLALLLGCT